jgi:NAD(P)-dependent dehydrogenase (short-subunit alcohol dehydrogenase family)
VPLRRFGRMDELRNLLIFLMSDGASYITGDTIAIDGGHHLAAPSTFCRPGEIVAGRLAARP